MKKFDRREMVFVERGRFPKFGIILAMILIWTVAVVIITLVVVNKNSDSDKDPVDVRTKVKTAATAVHEVVEDVVVGEEGEVSTDSKISLQDVVEISKLQTFSYTYNSFCPLINARTNQIEFYTSYEGTVTFSVDTDSIKSDIFKGERAVCFTIPKLKQEYYVDAGALKYIFIDGEPDDSGKLSTVAYDKCCKDLQSKCESNAYMIGLAKTNTEHELIALTEPLIKQMYGNDYKVKVIWGDD